MAKVMEFYRNSMGLCWVVGDDLNTCVLMDIIDRFVEPLVNWKIGYDIKDDLTYRNKILATIVEGNKKLEKKWYEVGCNSFEEKISRPMSFWTKQDIIEYSNKYLKLILKGNKYKNERNNSNKR